MSEASDAKNNGMRQVEENADPDWKDAAANAVWTLALRKEFLTSEDVRELVLHMYPSVETHELRALGPVMRTAAKHGFIEKHSFGFYGSKSRHQAPCQIWRSLLYDPNHSNGGKAR